MECLMLIYYDKIKENYALVSKYSKDKIKEYLNELNTKPTSKYRNIILDFFNSEFMYKYEDKKKIMQCLRHFDEVSISNNIYEDLDLIPKSCDYFLICGSETPQKLMLKSIVEEI